MHETVSAVKSLPAVLEICAQPFNAGVCLGIIYRAQPDLPLCGRCGRKGPGVVYERKESEASR